MTSRISRVSTRLGKAYGGPAALLRRYWLTYGGWRDFAFSPYLHSSLFLLVITYATWSEERWWEQIWTVVPSLLGFSLGALAIFLGFGSEGFRNVISGKKPGEAGKVSPYMSVTAAFTHFIVVQIFAVIVAVVSAALYRLTMPDVDSVFYELNLFARSILWGGGYWLFLYALCLAAASVLAVFRIAGWYDEHRTIERRKEAEEKKAAEEKKKAEMDEVDTGS